MARYSHQQNRRHRLPSRVLWVVLVFILLVVGGTFLARHIYFDKLKPVSTNQQTQIVSIASGSSVKQIGSQLSDDKLIRSSWAFELYVHSKELTAQLKAGTYAFSGSESTAQIVSTLTSGKTESKLVTILPGRRIDQVRADLINDGFSIASVNAALQPNQYADVPALAFKPASVNSLEGLLWPDSFAKDADTNPSQIIRESLMEMSAHLTPDVQTEFASEGLSTYQGLVLTSMIQQEVSKPTDQTQVAQVFLTRLKMNMMLGSNATANYGSIEAGHAPSLTFDSPYNTLIHTGLPPTPISTITANALMAATHPSATNWIYFVTGDDGTTYFSTTLQQQQANTQKYCQKNCSIP